MVFLMNKEASSLLAKLVTEIYKNEQLQQKVKHLEANWDELKGWLKANDIHYAEAIPFRETLNKMQELERGKE